MFDSITEKIANTKQTIQSDLTDIKTKITSSADDTKNSIQRRVEDVKQNIDKKVDDIKQDVNKKLEENKELVEAAQRVVLGEKVTECKNEIIFGFINGRVLWYDSFWKDYYFYLKNQHVIISLVEVHPFHPFDKKERLFVLLASLFCTFFVVSLANRLECCTDFFEGSSEEDEKMWLYVFPIIGGIIINIYCAVLKFFAECRCVQDKEGGFLKCFCELCGHAIMCISGVPSIILLVISIAFLVQDRYPYKDHLTFSSDYSNVSALMFFLMFLINQAASWIYGLLTGVLMFSYSMIGESQRKKMEKEKWRLMPELEEILKLEEKALIPSEKENTDTSIIISGIKNLGDESEKKGYIIYPIKKDLHPQADSDVMKEAILDATPSYKSL